MLWIPLILCIPVVIAAGEIEGIEPISEQDLGNIASSSSDAQDRFIDKFLKKSAGYLLNPNRANIDDIFNSEPGHSDATPPPPTPLTPTRDLYKRGYQPLFSYEASQQAQQNVPATHMAQQGNGVVQARVPATHMVQQGNGAVQARVPATQMVQPGHGAVQARYSQLPAPATGPSRQQYAYPYGKSLQQQPLYMQPSSQQSQQSVQQQPLYMQPSSQQSQQSVQQQPLYMQPASQQSQPSSQQSVQYGLPLTQHQPVQYATHGAVQMSPTSSNFVQPMALPQAYNPQPQYAAVPYAQPQAYYYGQPTAYYGGMQAPQYPYYQYHNRHSVAPMGIAPYYPYQPVPAVPQPAATGASNSAAAQYGIAPQRQDYSRSNQMQQGSSGMGGQGNKQGRVGTGDDSYYDTKARTDMARLVNPNSMGYNIEIKK